MQLAATATSLPVRLKALTDTPVLVGVGVSNAAQAAEACRVAGSLAAETWLREFVVLLPGHVHLVIIPDHRVLVPLVGCWVQAILPATGRGVPTDDFRILSGRMSVRLVAVEVQFDLDDGCPQRLTVPILLEVRYQVWAPASTNVR